MLDISGGVILTYSIYNIIAAARVVRLGTSGDHGFVETLTYISASLRETKHGDPY